MKKTTDQQNCEIQSLSSDIPGGVMRCLRDEFFTISEVNQEFIDMFGFDKEELHARFENSFFHMVHPADRKTALQQAAQSDQGNSFSLTVRMLCKDGPCKWTAARGRMDQSGKQLTCVLFDISDVKNEKEDLRLSLETHEIILDHDEDILFEWDFSSDTITCSFNWEKKFGYSPQSKGMNYGKDIFQHIYPDDITTLVNMMESAGSGTAYSVAEVRIQNKDGKYIWCRIRTTDQYDTAGMPVKAVGVITDIDKEKKMVESLRRRAERDALTGLYNREETETRIRRHLANKPDEVCAMFMIDTDNFKHINDSQGHLFGDAVLTELAAGMKKMTRRSDIAGRIGGDEFTIFLKNIPNREFAEEKAAQLLDMFRHLFQSDKQFTQITCSVGVAIYPENGRDFQTLYHSADEALYQAKSRGKNQFMLFQPDHAVTVNQTSDSSLGAAIDSDQRSSGVPGDLVNYVFQILYDTKEIDQAIQLILEIVGKRFDVSRAYIFENTEDGKYCSNTFEWCSDGIEHQKENLQNFLYDTNDRYEDLFGKNSIFYCRDIHVLSPSQVELFESQGICSTLQCAIREGEEGLFRGFVGFDECTGTRLWTKEEVGMLSLISQLLTTFLQKKRSVDRDRQMAVRLNTILDIQDAFIYAVAQDSYELLYLNHKTKTLDPGVKPGTTCYKAFFDRSQPCAVCPLQKKEGCEIYNPRYRLWTRVHAAPMKWGERDAYLITCFDITEYKKLSGEAAE